MYAYAYMTRNTWRCDVSNLPQTLFNHYPPPTPSPDLCILAFSFSHQDVPGFFGNRCLAPFMTEVTALVQEGVDLKFMDSAMVKFGMPVGPITLSGTIPCPQK